MLSISHGLTGAWVASVIPNPAIYIPTNLFLHYLEDWIPHWDIGTGMNSGKRKKQTVVILGLLDLALAFGLVYWLFQSQSNVFQWHIWLGLISGLIPDLIEAPKNFLKVEPAWTKPLNHFHHKIHYSTSNMLIGLATQVPVWIFVWAFSTK